VASVILSVRASVAAMPSSAAGFLPATMSDAFSTTSMTCAYCEAVAGSTRRRMPAAKSSATSGSPFDHSRFSRRRNT
jgi:hypothetical protein